MIAWQLPSGRSRDEGQQGTTTLTLSPLLAFHIVPWDLEPSSLAMDWGVVAGGILGNCCCTCGVVQA